MRVLKWLAIGLLGGVIVAAGALFALTRPMPVPDDCPPATEWSKIRALAQSISGDRPREVRLEEVLTMGFPALLAKPAADASKLKFVVTSYQLVYPDRTVILDTAMSPNQLNPAVDHFDNASWDRVVGAMGKAQAIYVTHEHSDHAGGMLGVPGATFLSHVHLTSEQIASSDRMEPAVLSAEARAAVQPLQYSDAIALAPGLVALKKPGHTPGSQWFYVQKADGTELLFLGDTAWFTEAIETEQGPPAIMNWMMKSDRHAVACELRDLHALATQEPKLQLVPGHEIARIDQLVASGALTRGFQ